MIRSGDTFPGHVVILEAVDQAGRVLVYDFRDLDEAFLPFFYAQSLYPTWRHRVVTHVEWKAELEGGTKPIIRR